MGNAVLDAAIRLKQVQAQAEAQTTRNSIAISDNLAVIENADASEVQSVSDMTDAAVTITKEKDGFAALADANNAQEAVEQGVNPNARTYKLGKLAADRDSNYDNAMKAEQIVYDKKNIKFMDDPLGWINAQVTLPADVETYNHFALRHNAAEDELNNTIKDATATGVMNNALKQTTSAAMADANIKEAIASGEQKVAEIRARFASINISGAQALQGITNAQLGQAETDLRLQDTLQMHALRQKQMAQIDEQNRMLKDQRIALNENRLDQQAMQQTTADQYNAGARALGAKVDLSPMEVMRKIQSDKTGQAMNIARYGQQISDNGGSTSTIPLLSAGQTVADLPGIMRSVGARPTGMDKDIYDWSAKAVEQTTLELHNTGQLPKDPVARAEAISKGVNAKALGQASLVNNSNGDFTNIYNAPTPAQLVTSVPALANIPELAELVKQSKDNPQVQFKDADVISTIVNSVGDKGTFKDRVNRIDDILGQYYNGAVSYNNTHKLYVEKGLPQQKNYTTALPTGVFGGNQNYDLRDPLQRKRLISKYIAPKQSDDEFINYN